MSWMTILKQGKRKLPESYKHPAVEWEIIIATNQVDNFIKDIEQGNYDTKGIRSTIRQLKEWEKNPRDWYEMPELKKLFEEEKFSATEITTLIQRIVDKVLPKLLEDDERKMTRQQKVDTDINFNNVDDVIREFSNIIQQDDKKQYLDEINENPKLRSYLKKTGNKHKNQYYDFARKNNLEEILDDYTNIITLEVRKGLSTEEEFEALAQRPEFELKGAKIYSEKMDLNDAKEMKNKLKEEGFEAYYIWEPIISLFDLKGKGLEKLTSVREKTEKEYKINPNFGGEHAQYYYQRIVKKGDVKDLIPDIYGPVPDNYFLDRNFLDFLDKRYDNPDIESIFEDFIDDLEKAGLRYNKKIKDNIISVITGTDDKYKDLLNDSELQQLEGKTTNQQKILLNGWLNTNSNFKQNFDAEKERLLKYSKFEITSFQKKLVEEFNSENIKSIKEEIEDLDQDEQETIQSISKIKAYKHGGINHVANEKNKTIVEKFANYIQENAENLDDLFGDEVGAKLDEIIDKVEEEEEEDIIIEEETGSTLEGLGRKEKPLAELVQMAFDNKKDLEDILENSHDYKFNFNDIFVMFVDHGQTMKTGQEFIKIVRSITLPKDYKKGQSLPDDVINQIKKLATVLDKDIAELRDIIINAAKEKVQDIVDNPSSFVVKEKRGAETGLLKKLLQNKVIEVKEE